MVKFSKSMTELSPFSDFPIISQWKRVNKISQDTLSLGSKYLVHMLFQKCGQPDKPLINFWLYLSELSPFSDIVILCSN